MYGIRASLVDGGEIRGAGNAWICPEVGSCRWDDLLCLLKNLAKLFTFVSVSNYPGRKGVYVPLHTKTLSLIWVVNIATSLSLPSASWCLFVNFHMLILFLFVEHLFLVFTCLSCYVLLAVVRFLSCHL